MNFEEYFSKKFCPFAFNYNLPISLSTPKYKIDLTLFVCTPVCNAYVENHNHIQYELHYHPNGQGTAIFNNAEYKIYPGCFYIIPPGMYHSFLPSLQNPCSEYVLQFNIKVNKKIRRTANDNIFNNFDRVIDIMINNIPYFGKDKNNVASTFANIAQQISSCGNNVNIAFFCYSIMAALIQTVDNIHPVPKISCTEIPNADILRKLTLSDESVLTNSQRLAKLDAIFRGFYPNISPEKIASDLFISVRQLDRICHQYYNMSFMQKYRESRMILASSLLEKFNNNKELTLNEIAQKLGYSSLKYFSKVFKQYYGISPKEYRDKYTQSQDVSVTG